MAHVVTGAVGSTGTNGTEDVVEDGHDIGRFRRPRSKASRLLDEVGVVEDDTPAFPGRDERRVGEP